MIVADEDKDLLAPSRQDAKFGIAFFGPWRLCVFARDIPTSGCGSAALGPWQLDDGVSAAVGSFRLRILLQVAAIP